MPKFRSVEKFIPAWNPDGNTVIREPDIKTFVQANREPDSYDRSLILLGGMVLDDQSKPVGREAIEAAPAAAFVQLGAVIPELLDEGKVDDPLDQKNSSDTA